MATILSYIAAAFAAAFGGWLALVLVTFVALRVAGAAAPTILVGGRIGGFAMLLPGFWLAIFIGSPLGGGLFIRFLGESAASFGLAFGFASSFFVCVLLGAIIGALLAAFIHWVRFTRNVA
jgi:hypothetical protein